VNVLERSCSAKSFPEPQSRWNREDAKSAKLGRKNGPSSKKWTVREGWILEREDTVNRRRKFSQEFKKEAVRLAREDGRSSKEVAEDLGIRADMLRRWVREFEIEREDAFRGSGVLRSEEDELRRVKRELARVKEERDILKKAVAIFSDKKR
jgi:transposase